MKQFKFTISGNTYDVEIKQFEDNVARIEVNGTTYDVEVHTEKKKTKTPTIIRSELPKTADKKIEKKESGSSTSVVAPLPGSIIEIYVKSGDKVKKGDKLLMMEAMKMENNILAEKDGVVESVKVSAGTNVLQGDLLIEMV